VILVLAKIVLSYRIGRKIAALTADMQHSSGKMRKIRDQYRWRETERFSNERLMNGESDCAFMRLFLSS